jgi:adenylate cyclase
MDFISLSEVAMSYDALGRHSEATSARRRALARIEKEIALRPYNTSALTHGAIALAYLGEKERATHWILQAQTIELDDPIDLYNLGCALALTNEVDEALNVLESCLPKMSPEFINWVKPDPDLTPLHDHPRYRALIARLEEKLAAVRAEQTT